MRFETWKYNLGYYSGLRWPRSRQKVKNLQCFTRRKSNIEILLAIYDLMGSYWIVLIRLNEKFRTINFFHSFWPKIHRNSMMADIDSHSEGVLTFFLWKFPMLSHFLNLKTITDDPRLRHCLGFETPFLYRAAVTGLYFKFSKCSQLLHLWPFRTALVFYLSGENGKF